MLASHLKNSAKAKKPSQNAYTSSKSTLNTFKSILTCKLTPILKTKVSNIISKKTLNEFDLCYKDNNQIQSFAQYTTLNKKTKKKIPIIASSLKKQPTNISQKKSIDNIKTTKSMTTTKKILQIKNNSHSCVNSGNLISNTLNNKKHPHKITQCAMRSLCKIKLNNIKPFPSTSPNTQTCTPSAGRTKIEFKTKPIISTTNNIKKLSPSNDNRGKKQNDYAKVFRIINHEIKEISDLFKHTQSVDHQKKNDSERNVNFLQLQTDVNENKDNDFDSDIFEKEISEEANEEKMVDISQLEGSSKWKVNNNNQSILFSSYNSELYKNLVNNDIVNNKEKSNDDYISYFNTFSSSSSRNNVIKIAQNNINGLFEINKKNYEDNKEEEKSNESGKTQCQFDGVAFNNEIHDDNERTEKTCNLIEEEDVTVRTLPIQEVM